ncbi:hypothetical protein GALMADRAFT_53755 [Galerina marginata CBS 339.88]|uniref:Large ribosomal subunit protein bL32m n=1 Tax=Galerina marginata (strain CBS 339.88) TaxID=685588 RepID=A0A067TP99_GALM3|nr:hypothetical protein GALMADRAFT_53755 [Galerina marginata CBS 339.88]
MAALALRQTQTLLPSIRRSLFASWLPPVLTATSLSLPRTSWSLPSLQDLLDLFPPFLLAVPKSKTSHSRKAMRSANKGLKDKRNITNCAGCGSVKLAHHICPNCYSAVTRQWKANNKQNAGDIPDMS